MQPETVKDPRLNSYCEKIELAFNQSRPASFDEEKKDFIDFLSEVGVSHQFTERTS